jgi:Mg-chelatase subunit ChlD
LRLCGGSVLRHIAGVISRGITAVPSACEGIDKQGHGQSMVSQQRAGMHAVFILDGSGSMSGEPWNQLCEAFQQYIDRRLGDDKDSKDIVSVVQFTHRARVVSQYVPIKQAEMGVPMRGGTAFLPAVLCGEECLATKGPAVSGLKPVVVMMTDGTANDYTSAAGALKRVAQRDVLAGDSRAWDWCWVLEAHGQSDGQWEWRRRRGPLLCV